MHASCCLYRLYIPGAAELAALLAPPKLIPPNPGVLAPPKEKPDAEEAAGAAAAELAAGVPPRPKLNDDCCGADAAAELCAPWPPNEKPPPPNIEPEDVAPKPG